MNTARIKKPRRLLIALLLFTSATAIALEQPESQVNLYRALHCKPTPQLYCANIHIGCAGQTSLRTWPFTVTTSGTRGRAMPANYQRTPQGLMIDGNVIQTPDYLLLNFPPTKAYLKILSSGKFSYRLYPGNEAVMTYGYCKND